jgi:hypothetical protein
MLAVLEKDSTYVRFWDLQQVQVAGGSPFGQLSRDSSQSKVVRRSWTGLPWATAAPVGRESIMEESHESSSTLVLADTRKSMLISQGC